MRIVITILVLLVSVNGFAQPRKKPVPKSAAPSMIPMEDESRYPLHSSLYFVPHKKVGASGGLGIEFASASVETPLGGSTATDEVQTTTLRSQVDVAYGVLPQLKVGIEFGYGTSTQKNTAYSDTAGNPNVPLEPDVKHKGLFDPQVTATYRPIESDFVLDLGAALRLGFLSAETGIAQDTIPDGLGRGDVATEGNFAEGSYGTELGARAGYQFSDRLNLLGSLVSEYNFEGTRTEKRAVGGDLVYDEDAYIEFGGRAEVEYFLTPEFVLAPFANLVFTPKRKSSYVSGGLTSNFEYGGYKTYVVGIAGSYLLQPNMALKAGYSYSSSDNSKVQRSIAGSAFTDVTNTKDRESHSIFGSIAYQF